MDLIYDLLDPSLALSLLVPNICPSQSIALFCEYESSYPFPSLSSSCRSHSKLHRPSVSSFDGHHYRYHLSGFTHTHLYIAFLHKAVDPEVAESGG